MPVAGHAGRPAPNTLAVYGGLPLGGELPLSGFKHSLVTAVAASCLGQAPVRIRNCPDITETEVLAELVVRARGSAERSGETLLVDAAGLDTPELDPELVGAIHGSVYLAPALLVRFGMVTVPGSGGCQLGPPADLGRPVAHYVDVLRRFGAAASLRPDGGFTAAASQLRPANVDLLDYAQDRAARTGPHYSGATKVAVLAAAGAAGISVLQNPYPKPDVTDMVSLLLAMGAEIEQSADRIVVYGDPDRLRRSADWTLLPDLIEIVTWCCAGALLGADGLALTGSELARAAAALAPELAVLDAMGVHVEVRPDAIAVRPPSRFAPVDVVAASHGVYSDSQPFLTLLTCWADGTSRIRDSVWHGRFGYVDQLELLGVRTRRVGDCVFVDGPCPPVAPGRRLVAEDLRAAAVLLLAALTVPGEIVLDGMHHLARGYRDLPSELRRLGADIKMP